MKKRRWTLFWETEKRSREGERRGGRRLDPALTGARTRVPSDLEATEN